MATLKASSSCILNVFKWKLNVSVVYTCISIFVDVILTPKKIFFFGGGHTQPLNPQLYRTT